MRDEFNQTVQEGIAQAHEGANSTTSQMNQLQEEYQAFKQRTAEDITHLKANVQPTLTEFTAKCRGELDKFKQWLYKEMNDKIDKSVAKAKEQILQRYKSLNLKFSQECLNLRGEVERIRELFEDRFKASLLKEELNKSPEKKIADLNQEIKRRLGKFQEFTDKTLENLEEIVQQTQELLAEFDEKANKAIKELEKVKQKQGKGQLQKSDVESFKVQKKQQFEEMIVEVK